MKKFEKSSIALMLIVFSMFSCERADNAMEYDSQESVSQLRSDDFKESERSKVLGNGTVSNGFISADEKAEPESKSHEESESTFDQSKIIKNGWITMEAQDYDAARRSVQQLITSFGAFVGNENEQRDEYRVRNSLVIKVHNSRFEELMSAIAAAKGVAHIDERRVSAVDVGEEFFDITSRLRSKREVEKRYLEILRQAKTIKDILSVEEKIRVIQEKIESAQGRLNYLNDRVSRSTIHVDIYQNLDYTVPPTERRGFWSKMGRAFESGWNGILNAIVFLGYLWPLLLLLMALGWFWMTRRKRRSSAN